MGKRGIWLHNKRALSPIFATVLLATIIIIFGSVAYYYATNLTNTATNNYVNNVANSQQSMSERIGFENVVYNNQSNPQTLTVSIVNYGSANNVKIDTVFLYNSSHNIVPGSPYSGPTTVFTLYPVDGGTPTPTPIASLNTGQEAYFTIIMQGPPLNSGLYTIHLITESGSYFDYEFTL